MRSVICCAGLLLLCSGCMIDETDRRAAGYVALALPDNPELAKPVAEKLAVRLGAPKVPVTVVSAENTAVLAAEAGQPKSKMNTLGKFILGLIGIGIAFASGKPLLGKDC